LQQQVHEATIRQNPSESVCVCRQARALRICTFSTEPNSK
jgi:hypothetical protein